MPYFFRLQDCAVGIVTFKKTHRRWLVVHGSNAYRVQVLRLDQTGQSWTTIADAPYRNANKRNTIQYIQYILLISQE